MVQLHLHSIHSMLDGIVKPKEAAALCKALGEPAIACTDHGTLSGLAEWHREARRVGVKPILGYEAYHDRGDGELYHLVLLAKNRAGYDNLVRMNNAAYLNFKGKPRVTDRMLIDWGRGLIALTACVQGYFPTTVCRGKPDLQWLGMLREWIPDTFLEVQNHGIPEEKVFLDWAVENGHEIVGTTDAHFLSKEHAEAHEISLAISMNKKAGQFRFPGSGYWIHDPDLPPEALENTYRVADLVEEYGLGHENWLLPSGKADPVQEFNELGFRLMDYLNSKFDMDVPPDILRRYEDRLRYEFSVIEKGGFLPYMKMVGEICDFVDRELKSVRGWGRGSAGGSLVVMLYNITKIDPVEWGLHFERFLNPERISPPDIDLDFKPEDRLRVIEWMRNRYGRAYQICAFGTLSSREVVASTVRATGWDVGDLLEYIPKTAPIPSVKELLEAGGAFAQYVEKKGLQKEVCIFTVLEGCLKSSSAHASGVVVDFAEELPYRIARSGVNAGVPVCAYDMYSLDYLKTVKFDILGVNTLSVVDDAWKMGFGGKKDIARIDLNDPAVYKTFCAGNAAGVFQYETHSFRGIVERMQPSNFLELVDLNALGRPGCLDSGITEEYIRRKDSGKAPRFHPKMELGHQNLPLFQEDLMNVARTLAGFSMSEADTLRKAIGKKQKDVMDSLKTRFLEGCRENGSTGGAGIWETVEKSARYSWNLSHAVCYTLISYWCMYLSHYKPAEFFCALLSNAAHASDSFLKRRMLLSECRRRGIEVLHPDLNESQRDFTVKDGKILLGLSGIRMCGEKVVDSILETRKMFPIRSSTELPQGKVNSRTAEFLLKAGCFPREHKPTYEEEVESLGYSISGRMVDRLPYCKIRGAGEVLKLSPITDKNGNPMCFVTVESAEGSRDMVAFHRVWSEVSGSMGVGQMWIFAEDSGGVVVSARRAESDWKVKLPADMERDFGEFAGVPRSGGNVCAGKSWWNLDLDEEFLSFIDRNFGIEEISCGTPLRNFAK